MKTTTAVRLAQIMNQRNLRQTDILEMCKPYCQKYGVEIRRSDLSQYVSGKVKPNQYRLTILALALNVTEPYLMGYDVSDKGNDIDYVIGLYNKLSETDKAEIKNLMEFKLNRRQP